jgi:phage-related protein
MGQFSFTIPAAEVDTLRNTTGSVDEEFVVDRGFVKNTTQTVLNANFGDGYEQRAANGINPKKEMLNISFNNRAAADIYLLAAYFDSKIAASFTLTITSVLGAENIKVVSDTYNINYIQENYHSLSSTLRRVYEP